MAVKILLAVDGSDCALRAADHVIEHASWLGEAPQIELLYVQPPIPIAGALAHVGKETLNAHYLEEGREQLQAAEARLKEAGQAHATHIHVGQPAETIARMAQDLGCNLIVMGTHGRTALSSLVTGSVATRVLHLAPCPVLLVK